MNMLNVSIDEININIFLFCIISYVMKQVLLGIFRKNRLAVLCAPYGMYPYFDV